MTTFRVTAAIFAIATVIISGCGKKPPECGDPAVQELILSDLRGDAQDQVGNTAKEIPNSGEAAKEYLSAFKVALSAITNEGSASNSKANSCRGELAIETARGSVNRPITYSVHLTEDKPGAFIVRVNSGKLPFNAIAGDFSVWYDLRARAKEKEQEEAKAKDESWPQCIGIPGRGQYLSVSAEPVGGARRTNVQGGPFRALARSGPYLKIAGSASSEGIPDGQEIGWVFESNIEYYELRNCN